MGAERFIEDHPALVCHNRTEPITEIGRLTKLNENQKVSIQQYQKNNAEYRTRIANDANYVKRLQHEVEHLEAEVANRDSVIRTQLSIIEEDEGSYRLKAVMPVIEAKQAKCDQYEAELRKALTDTRERFEAFSKEAAGLLARVLALHVKEDERHHEQLMVAQAVIDYQGGAYEDLKAELEATQDQMIEFASQAYELALEEEQQRHQIAALIRQRDASIHMADKRLKHLQRAEAVNRALRNQVPS